jgi:hypothetical protein
MKMRLAVISDLHKWDIEVFEIHLNNEFVSYDMI